METSKQAIEQLLAGYRAAELHILRLLANTAATATGTRGWYDAQGTELRKLIANAEKVLKKAHPTKRELEQVLRTGYIEGAAQVTPGGKVPATIAAPAAALTTQEIADGLTSARRTILRTTEDAYRKINRTAVVGQIASGANRTTRLQAVLDDYAREGLTAFRDRAGRKWSMDTYAEMALRTGANRAQNQGRIAGYRAQGVELVRTSQHKGSHPLCVPWQNKILAVDGEAGTREMDDYIHGGKTAVHVHGTLDDAIASGYHHVNCRHTDTAFTVGMDLPDDIETGEEEYAAEQRQRAIERHIREWKRREATALTPSQQQYAAGKVRAWQAAQREHLSEHGWLSRRYDREKLWAGQAGKGLRVPPPPKIKPVFEVPAEYKWTSKPSYRALKGNEGAAAEARNALTTTLGDWKGADGDQLAQLFATGLGKPTPAMEKAARDVLKARDNVTYAKAVEAGKAYSPLTAEGAAAFREAQEKALKEAREALLSKATDTATAKELADITAKAKSVEQVTGTKLQKLKKPLTPGGADHLAKYVLADTEAGTGSFSPAAISKAKDVLQAKRKAELLDLLGDEKATALHKAIQKEIKKDLADTIKDELSGPLLKKLGTGYAAEDPFIAAKYKAAKDAEAQGAAILANLEEMEAEAKAALAESKAGKAAAKKGKAASKTSKTSKAASKTGKAPGEPAPAVNTTAVTPPWEGSKPLPIGMEQADLDALLVLKGKQDWKLYDKLLVEVSKKTGQPTVVLNDAVNYHIVPKYGDLGDVSFFKSAEGKGIWKDDITNAEYKHAIQHYSTYEPAAKGLQGDKLTKYKQKYWEDFNNNKAAEAAKVQEFVSSPTGFTGTSRQTMPEGFKDAPEVKLMAAHRAAHNVKELDDWVQWYAKEHNLRPAEVLREVTAVADETYPGALAQVFGKPAKKTVKEAKAQAEALAKKVEKPAPPEQYKSDRINKLAQEAKAMGWASKRWETSRNLMDMRMSAPLNQYTTGQYRMINSALRESNGAKAHRADYLKEMDRAFDLSPRNPQRIELHRGTDVEQFMDNALKGTVTDDPASWVGKEFVDHGYMSTSLGGKAAFSHEPIIMHIDVPKGAKMAYVDSADPLVKTNVITQFPGEREVILQRGTQFKVSKVETDAEGKVHVWAKLTKQQH